MGHRREWPLTNHVIPHIRSGVKYLLVKKMVFPRIRLLQTRLIGKSRLVPRVNTAREKRTPKSMNADGVVPEDRRRTALCSRTNTRRITCVRNGTGSKVSPK